jgi:hypothetical protein
VLGWKLECPGTVRQIKPRKPLEWKRAKGPTVINDVGVNLLLGTGTDVTRDYAISALAAFRAQLSLHAVRA